MSHCRMFVLGLLFVVASTASADDRPPLPEMQLTHVSSTIDGESQPVRFWAPTASPDENLPILVSLHTWSADGSQDRGDWLRQAVRRKWVYIQPNFRGRNDHPEACGSPLARQDVLDALDWALETFPIDRERIYLAGVSGGGHMTMQMAAYHPERFSAASAWVGPTDLAEWYRYHAPTGRPGKYAQMIAACCGGAPGDSTEIDAQYRARSPVFHLAKAVPLPLDINAGVKDGITGSVPIHHSLRAYNTIAAANGDPTISPETMDELWGQGRLQRPEPSDTQPDSTYGRDILLRRTSGQTRVTIFDGTHEALPAAACEWLSRYQREVGDSAE
ncbi:MAG: prolyl oligopeptidase family serine peptidase [Planctomycetaceae bacterium]|nr:prolyl oligopeptidase family serine peptidase [Planctomycetaceae bacterium]